ncbi:shikimate kinase [Salinibacillus xinjiangensis]|uniref:Shikimate kinase n=1 Tax=Salinibacillus xinjiangensis TaxID=1229268 RepID=A0A6G1X6E7_9BACI|nr:shikimate kinase [Salinibacillus xinjiangensis]MRG86573.1 shikimate kinase [Salinibacillus xinjiangensis]
MKSICLIGFMGSGKTTIGEAVAKKLDLTFLDTDSEIEKWREFDIPTIFETEGEGRFREYETQVLKKLPFQSAVIATGGGIIEKEENRKWLSEHFFVVYLQTSFDVIQQRLDGDEGRPLWNQELEKKEKLYKERKPKYIECADFILNIRKQSVSEVVDQIVSGIKQI